MCLISRFVSILICYVLNSYNEYSKCHHAQTLTVSYGSYVENYQKAGYTKQTYNNFYLRFFVKQSYNVF